MSRVLLVIAICFSLSAFSGCGGKSGSISGTVTYDGKPIDNGNIAFLPTGDDAGQSLGAPIQAGKFQIDQVPPGTRVVQIAGNLFPRKIVSSEDFARKAKDLPLKKKKDGSLDPLSNLAVDDFVPPNALGNNVKIEIQAGSQTLNFELKKP